MGLCQQCMKEGKTQKESGSDCDRCGEPIIDK